MPIENIESSLNCLICQEVLDRDDHHGVINVHEKPTSISNNFSKQERVIGSNISKLIIENRERFFPEKLSHLFHRNCIRNFFQHEVSTNCPICREDISHLMLNYSFEGIGNRNALPNAQRHAALIQAVENGDSNGVRRLLQSGPISNAVRGTAIEYAAMHADLEALQLLLQSGPISEESREVAVEFAAANANLEALRHLVQSGTISNEVRERVMSRAARGARANSEVFALLSQNNAQN